MQAINIWTIQGRKVTGPDFNDPSQKTICLSNGYEIRYTLPGGTTPFTEFLEKYQQKRFQLQEVSVFGDERYQQQDWRYAKALDGAVWHYTGRTLWIRQKELANLAIRIEINKLSNPRAASLKDYLVTAYKKFLQVSHKTNTEVQFRTPGPHKNMPIQWLSYHPDFIRKLKVHNTEFICWETFGEEPGMYLAYYARWLDSQHQLFFRFKYSIAIKSKKRYQKQMERIHRDIERIISNVTIKQQF